MAVTNIDENESQNLHFIGASSDKPFILKEQVYGQNVPKNFSYQESFLEFIKPNNSFYPII